MSAAHSQDPRRGFGWALAAALCVAALATLVFGVGDAVVAAWTGTADLGVGSFLACTAAAVSEYALLVVPAACVAALALRPLLDRRTLPGRVAFLAFLVFGTGLFLELYWRTRPFVFYGRSARSPERIVATVAIALVAFVVVRFLARRIGWIAARFGPAWVALLVLVSALGAAYRYAQRDVLAGRGAITDANRELPNVLLFVVDALRQDRLGCYGDARASTPHVDRLAREGVVFENAFTQAPFTWSSFGSFLTGKYPRRHGLVEMRAGARMVPNRTLPLVLKSATRIGGARLTDGDFLAASFHTGTLSTGSGLLRGFDVYYEQMAGHGLVTTDDTWSVFRSDLLLEILRSKLAQKTGSDVAGTAREWLSHNGARRFFAMVHLYSTHTPYDPPAEHKAKFCDPAYRGPFRAFYAQQREAIESGAVEPTPADVEQIRNLYRAGVSEVDAKIGDVVAELERQGVLDHTIVVVMSDHGESLGERDLVSGLDLWEHDHMTQTNLRIPLVVRYPARIPAGTRVAPRVDEIDLLPTLCDLVGIATPAPEPGDVFGIVDGKSALPLVHGGREPLHAYSFAENGLFMSVQDDRWKLVVPSELACESGWASATTDGRRATLVDLASDPGETTDVLAREPERAKSLADALCAWSTALPKARMDRSERDVEEMRRRLNELGYADGVGQGVVRRTPRR